MKSAGARWRRNFSDGSNDSHADLGGRGPRCFGGCLGARRLGPTLPAGLAQEGDRTSTRVGSAAHALQSKKLAQGCIDRGKLRRAGSAEQPNQPRWIHRADLVDERGRRRAQAARPRREHGIKPTKAQAGGDWNHAYHLETPLSADVDRGDGHGGSDACLLSTPGGSSDTKTTAPRARI